MAEIQDVGSSMYQSNNRPIRGRLACCDQEHLPIIPRPAKLLVTLEHMSSHAAPQASLPYLGFTLHSCMYLARCVCTICTLFTPMYFICTNSHSLASIFPWGGFSHTLGSRCTLVSRSMLHNTRRAPTPFASFLSFLPIDSKVGTGAASRGPVRARRALLLLGYLLRFSPREVQCEPGSWRRPRGIDSFFFFLAQRYRTDHEEAKFNGPSPTFLCEARATPRSKTYRSWYGTRGPPHGHVLKSGLVL